MQKNILILIKKKLKQKYQNQITKTLLLRIQLNFNKAESVVYLFILIMKTLFSKLLIKINRVLKMLFYMSIFCLTKYLKRKAFTKKFTNRLFLKNLVKYILFKNIQAWIFFKCHKYQFKSQFKRLKKTKLTNKLEKTTLNQQIYLFKIYLKS